MIRHIAIGFLLLCLLSACVSEESEPQNLGKVKADSPESVQSSVMNKAYQVVNLIKDEKMEELADYIHPKKGVLFSPYGKIDKKRAQVFMPPLFKDLFHNSKQLEWGTNPETGDPIRLNFDTYFDHYVYDAEYGETDFVTYDGVHKEANRVQNVEGTFTESHYVEFFVPASEDTEGMEWKCLILVFSGYGGKPYLVGIIHDQWIS